MRSRTPIAITGLLLAATVSGQAPPLSPSPVVLPTERNVVFGNVGDAALLMDVYRPRSANGVAIIFISGSGWGGMPGYDHDYDDVLLKDDALASAGYEGRIVQGLANRGYTVFAITHRFAPEVRSPQPIYDAQRAVRFVRANAAKYGIDPTRLGAIGHSSGAHLAAMLGVIDTTIDNPRGIAAQSGSSKVQAVVTLAAPFDVTDILYTSKVSTRVLSNLFGGLPERGPDGAPLLKGSFADASPITRVTANAAPMLMYHAQNDSVILKRSAERMDARLTELNVSHRLVMRSSGGHRVPYDLDEIESWLRTYLVEGRR